MALTLEVDVHDQLLERMALHVTQQHLLHVAIEVQVQDRRVEPLVLLGKPDLLVVELDTDRLEFATVDDGRNDASVTQAAARTLPLVCAALDLDFVSLCHVVSLPRLEYRLAAIKRLTRDQERRGTGTRTLRAPNGVQST